MSPVKTTENRNAVGELIEYPDTDTAGITSTPIGASMVGSPDSFNGTNGSWTLNKPAGVAEGDLLVFVGCARGNHRWAKTGWTEASYRRAAEGGNSTTMSVLYLVAGASEPATYNFSATGGWTTGALFAYTNVPTIVEHISDYNFVANVTTAGVDAPTLDAIHGMAARGLVGLQLFYQRDGTATWTYDPVSPNIVATTSSGGIVISITDALNSDSISLRNGETSANGAQGQGQTVILMPNSGFKPTDINWSFAWWANADGGFECLNSSGNQAEHDYDDVAEVIDQSGNGHDLQDWLGFAGKYNQADGLLQDGTDAYGLAGTLTAEGSETEDWEVWVLAEAVSDNDQIINWHENLGSAVDDMNCDFRTESSTKARLGLAPTLYAEVTVTNLYDGNLKIWRADYDGSTDTLNAYIDSDSQTETKANFNYTGASGVRIGEGISGGNQAASGTRIKAIFIKKHGHLTAQERTDLEAWCNANLT